MNKIKNTPLLVSYTMIYILVLSISDLFAAPSVFEAIKQVETQDKPVSNEFIQRPNMTYKASDLRDPFQPYITEEDTQETPQKRPAVLSNQGAENPPPSLIVQGIIWGGNFPQAIINNKVVKIGETIEGALIKGIDKEGVTLIFEGREHKLPVTVSKRSPENKTLFSGGEYEKNF